MADLASVSLPPAGDIPVSLPLCPCHSHDCGKTGGDKLSFITTFVSCVSCPRLQPVRQVCFTRQGNHCV